MKTAGICGHFGLGKELLNGQTIKTKIISKELENQLGKNEVQIVDSHNSRSRLLHLIFNCLRMSKDCRNIIIMPANNGLKVFVPLFSLLNKLYHRKLHYIVIGGWLTEVIDESKWLKKLLKNFDGIYVETNTMKAELEWRGFTNIYIMKNCKDLRILNVDELVYPSREPYKLCTFSRVMHEKGIEDAIDAVKHINEKYSREVYTLDIYGQVEDDYTERFEELCKGFPSYIRYCGLVPFNKSVEVLKGYSALLFPTRFATEGIPGTIIDAYCAGIPVISAKWNSFSDIIDEGSTGVGYELKSMTALINTLMNLSDNNSMLFYMKNNCLKKAYGFVPQTVIKEFITFLNRG